MSSQPGFPRQVPANLYRKPARLARARHVAGKITESEIARFWSRVQKSESCWYWIGALNAYGYGHFSSGTRPNAKIFRAHRLAWELTNGAVPDGMSVCHSCDVRSCVNPAHLWLGTQSDNLVDASRKGRLVRPLPATCRHGHEYTPENTAIARKDGSRVCRTCKRLLARRLRTSV